MGGGTGEWREVERREGERDMECEGGTAGVRADEGRVVGRRREEEKEGGRGE